MSKKNKKKIKKALKGNNKLTNSEIRNLTNAGIGLDKIIKVAAKNNATIGQGAQQAFNIDQNKKGVISYTPPSYASPPKPGSGFAVTGSQTTPGTTRMSRNNGITTTLPTYTYMPSTKVTVTKAAPAPAPTQQQEAPASSQTTNWMDSVNDAIDGMVSGITDAIAANQAQQDLYMGDLSTLMSQMAMQQPAQQMMTPYAMTTTTNAPVQGAQTTEAIRRRRRNVNTSLAIAPAVDSSGTGLNIPV